MVGGIYKLRQAQVYYDSNPPSGNLGVGSIGSSEILDNEIVNADVDSAAGIVYSKLTLTDSVVDADINASAAIAQSKLAIDITNSEVNASAAIAQTKLALDITDSEVNASAAIAQTKLALDITDSEVNASAAIAQTKLALDITNAEINASAAIVGSKLSTAVQTKVAAVRIGAVAATDDRYLFIAPTACTVTDVVLVSDTATTGSDVTNNYTFQIYDHVGAVDLLATAKTTNGADIGADTEYNITPDQNQALVAGDILELQITKNNAPTDLSGAEVFVQVEYTTTA